MPRTPQDLSSIFNQNSADCYCRSLDMESILSVCQRVTVAQLGNRASYKYTRQDYRCSYFSQSVSKTFSHTNLPCHWKLQPLCVPSRLLKFFLLHRCIERVCLTGCKCCDLFDLLFENPIGSALFLTGKFEDAVRIRDSRNRKISLQVGEVFSSQREWQCSTSDRTLLLELWILYKMRLGCL